LDVAELHTSVHSTVRTSDDDVEFVKYPDEL
jgi:hypothetical protein